MPDRSEAPQPTPPEQTRHPERPQHEQTRQPGLKLMLMVVADQLRADHLGFGGLEAARTPNLDALAAAGTVFERAHATNPTCMPSRASLATGRWPSAHGTRTNGVPLDPTARTLAGALRADGWFTAAVGKLHFQTMGWPAEPFQIEEIAATNPATTDAGLPDARACWQQTRDDWEHIARHRDGLVSMPEDYYGFTAVDLVSGHGDRASGHYWHWVRSQGVDPDTLAGWENAARRSDAWDQIWQSRVPAEASTSRYVAERAAARIEEAAGRAGATFVFASFPDPHHPFCPPAPYSDLCAPADLDPPATFEPAPERLPPHIQRMLAARGAPHRDPMLAFAVTAEQYRQALAHEVGLMAMLDESVGLILDRVRASGLADRTAVVFTSDHGDLFGDHGLMLKHHVHYEGVTRVPLVLSGPGIAARRCRALVSNADVVPTLLELASARPHRGMQGRSLAPLLAGGTDAHRDAVLVEEDQPFGTSGLDGPVRMRTLVTDDGRLTVYHGEKFAECYDLADDPDETVNLSEPGTSSPLERHLRELLLDEILALADEGLAMLHGA